MLCVALVLVSCPKGQVEKYVNVEACCCSSSDTHHQVFNAEYTCNLSENAY